MRRAGFTLLEVMVAIGILAIIVGLIYGSISMTADSKEEVETGNDVYQQARWALDKMDQDLTSAFVSKNQQTHSLFYALHRKNSDGLPLDEVHFTSFNHVKYNPNARESDQAEISYFVMENPDNGVMTLYRREDAKMDANNLEGGDFYDLVENVVSLSLRYWDGEQWVDEWDTRNMTQQAESTPTGDATPPSESEVQNQTDTMINTLPLAVEVGLLVAAPREMQLAFNTKIRLVLSTIDLSAMDEDQSGQGSQQSGGETGGGTTGGGATGGGKTSGGLSKGSMP
jgi:general secretion pathway protein J